MTFVNSSSLHQVLYSWRYSSPSALKRTNKSMILANRLPWVSPWISFSRLSSASINFVWISSTLSGSSRKHRSVFFHKKIKYNRWVLTKLSLTVICQSVKLILGFVFFPFIHFQIKESAEVLPRQILWELKFSWFAKWKKKCSYWLNRLSTRYSSTSIKNTSES